jgi:outer membrane receptor protein involved in Fe transport
MVGSSVRSWIALGVMFFPVAANHLSAQTTVASERSERVTRATSATVTIDVTNAPLDRVLRLIAQRAGLGVVLNGELMQPPRRVTLHLRNVRVSDAFERALAGTDIKASIGAGNVAFSLGDESNAVSQGIIMGKVIDAESNLPLRNAVVTVSGSSKSVTTGDDGVFRMFALTSGTYTVTARLLGYTKATQTATVTDGQTSVVNFALGRSANALDQVVVTGTVVATAQKAIPNAMTVITAKELEQRGITRLDQLFRGDVPGLFAANRGTAGGNGTGSLQMTNMYSRGSSALPGNGDYIAPAQAIKTYVDGVELANYNNLATIDPRSIERVEIVTGPQASTIYGSGAINGVMQIFTKRGTTVRPQFTATLLSGFIENDFRAALTPQHDYSAQVSAVEGRLSYNAGGTWMYTGRWNPSQQESTINGFAGVRMESARVTADATFRMGKNANSSVGSVDGTTTAKSEGGIYVPGVITLGRASRGRTNTQTLGATLGVRPFSWWSHQLVVGRDVSEQMYRANPGYLEVADSGGGVYSYGNGSSSARNSLSYNTTAQVPVTRWATAMLTLGADEWRRPGTSYSLNRTNNITSGGTFFNRNSGAFAQAQLTVFQALTLTSGLRAERNPSMAKENQPAYSRRFGAAYAFETGEFSGKLRASYGRATRPASLNSRIGFVTGDPYEISIYGRVPVILPNPDLGPEYQQGGEGGVDLYWGRRWSLTVTRYNQTVDQLIASVIGIDSVPSLQADPFGFCSFYPPACGSYSYFRQNKDLNVGSVRNQGWELQSTITLGPVSTRGTYSWNKSRMIGITPAYRALFPVLDYPTYQPGSTFSGLAEHTWAVQATYAMARTSVTFNVNGVGVIYGLNNNKVLSNDTRGLIRIRNSQPRVITYSTYRYPKAGYATADLNATHRFAAAIEGVLQVQNLGDVYYNDYNTYPVLGRQTKAGLRLRF